MKRRNAATVSGTTTAGIAHIMFPNIDRHVDNNAN
jgi:hypothetical protein